LNIAVTGNIGSGKSVVARELAVRLGAEYCNADLVCRELLEKDAPGWKAFVHRWHSRYLDDEGNIDRVALRRAIFADGQLRSELESILHPLVRQRLQELMRQCRHQQKHLVAEIPLLFESGWQHEFDRVVTVYAGPEISIRRVVARDGVSRQQVQRALAVQMDIDEKAKSSDYVIDNSQTLERTLSAVDAVVGDLQT